MAQKSVSESDYEELIIDLFKESDYEYIDGPTISPGGKLQERDSYTDVLLITRLRKALKKINPKKNEELIEGAIKTLLSIQSQSIVESNFNFHKLLVNGIQVEFKRPDGTIGGDYISLIDFQNPEKNEFLIVNQFTIVNERGKERRPDVIVFVNGLPLVVVELKNPVDENATIINAFNQIQTYKGEMPQLFYYNEFCIFSDGVITKVGTLSSDFEHFKQWKIEDRDNKLDVLAGSFEVIIDILFKKRVFMDYIRNFIVYDDDGRGNKNKKMAAYHQYYASNNAIESTVLATSPAGDRKCGIVWHTQGSGKSLTMVFYAGKMIQDQRMNNPTLIVLTDRIDLDNQLFEVFSHCNHILRQMPQQAESREDLTRLLKVASGGIVFTTINKFFPAEGEKKYPMLTDRRNVVVIVDEAHRSQYDLIDGFAAHMRDALPNASFIAFTGTPIDLADRSTINVFGNYISVYDIKKSIEDGTTVPIYYESRLIRIDIPDEQKALLDDAFDSISEDMEYNQREKEKRKWSMLEALVGVDKRIDLVAADIVKHFEQRQETMFGKAMIVCMSRRICVELYDSIIALRPEWAGTGDEDSQLNVIMTGSATDPLDWQKHIRNKQKRNDMAYRFKKVDDPFKIVIVRDMWLTGFDVPCLHTMYIDKPMHDHGLMQAIARVNRVFKEKPGGLVVDYIGIADSLAKAVGTYSRGGGKGTFFIDKKDAERAFLSKYEVCDNMMHGYDRGWWYAASKKERILRLRGAVDFVIKLENGEKRLKENVSKLTQAYYLATPNDEIFKYKEDVAFFQSLRAFVVKLTESPKKTTTMVDEALRQVLSSAIVSQEPTDVLELLGYEKTDISILSEEFLSRIQAMPERNLAAELLKRILNEHLSLMMRTNIVQSKKFSELLQESITRYEKRIIDTTEFINILIKFAKEMKVAEARGEVLNLTSEELAFYDALSTDDIAVKLMGDEILRNIATDVAKRVTENMTVDWSIRESARAQMRKEIKRVLRINGYPPEKTEDATDLIIRQAELICNSKIISE